MDYRIPQTIVKGGPQVFPYLVNGRRVFVKKRRPNKNPMGWITQRILYRLTGFLLVLPPARPVGDNVAFESGVLRRLGAMGLPVPEVLFVDDEYFVMSDAGICLEAWLRDNPGQTSRYIGMALRALRCLHGRGLAHGGAQTKNLTVCEDGIFFIDFEENIPPEHLAKFQLRDVFLFLLSLQRTGHDPDLAELCRLYDGDDSGETLEGIRKALAQLRVVRLCEFAVFNRFSMRDIRSLACLIRKAEHAARQGKS